jgi:hypothetical protein
MPVIPTIKNADPFEITDSEAKAWSDTVSAVSSSNPNVASFTGASDHAAYEIQRSVRALGIILMRVERVAVALDKNVTKLTAAMIDLTSSMKPRRRKTA